MKDLLTDYKFILPLCLSIYAALLTTYSFYFDRRGKFKITYERLDRCILADMTLTTLFAFKIVNVSSRKRSIINIGYEFNKGGNGTIFSPRVMRYPTTPLEFGEGVEYEVYYSDFDNIFEKIEGKKFRLVVTDTTNKVYRTKWIKKNIPKGRENHFKINTRNSVAEA